MKERSRWNLVQLEVEVSTKSSTVLCVRSTRRQWALAPLRKHHLELISSNFLQQLHLLPRRQDSPIFTLASLQPDPPAPSNGLPSGLTPSARNLSK